MDRACLATSIIAESWYPTPRQIGSGAAGRRGMANGWRKKVLTLAEWSALQNDFANLQILAGAPANLAMFVKGHAGDPASDIYITGPGIEEIEARSPSGWEDADAPSGEGVSLLVGEGDPWAHFGIEKPV